MMQSQRYKAWIKYGPRGNDFLEWNPVYGKDEESVRSYVIRKARKILKHKVTSDQLRDGVRVERVDW